MKSIKILSIVLIFCMGSVPTLMGQKIRSGGREIIYYDQNVGLFGTTIIPNSQFMIGANYGSTANTSLRFGNFTESWRLSHNYNHNLHFSNDQSLFIFHRNGDLEVPGNLIVEGSEIIQNSVTENGDLTVNGNLTVLEEADIQGSLKALSKLEIGATQFSGNPAHGSLEFASSFLSGDFVWSVQSDDPIVFTGHGIEANAGGNVGIGVLPDPSYKLDVAGTIHADATGVDDYALIASGVVHIGPHNSNHLFSSTTSLEDAYLFVEEGIATEDLTYIFAEDWDEWPDYVFDEEYELRDLDHLEDYIRKHNHLPEVISQQEIKERGVSDKQMNITLLKKIEELTLYTIEQDNALQAQQVLNDRLLERLEILEAKVSELTHE